MKEQLHGSPKERFPKKAAWLVLRKVPVLSVAVLALAGCPGGGGEKNNTQELENKVSSGYALPFPEGETWFLTGGPHADGFSNGVRNAIDIAPPELGHLNGQCPTDGSRLVIENRVITASASGEVIVAGDDKNRSDPSHSMIKIKDANGLTEVYIHAANIKVKKGSKVKQGAPLGNPSCEFPPGGGRNEGAHIHVGLEKDGQAIPIDGVEIGGWTIHNEPKNYDGTMTKPGEKTRTANTGRYGENSTGIRNDLTNNGPSRAVVASPKDPIPPISGKVNEKKAEAASATPKKETPTQIQKEQPKFIEQQMQEVAFRTWLSLWSIHSEIPGNVGYRYIVSYNIDIVNTNIEDIINKNGNIGKPLDITWAGGQLAFGPSENRAQAYKNVGEVQIDKIRAQTSGIVPTSDADKANGLQWVGGTTVTYIIRSRGNSYAPRGEWGSSEALKKWIVSKDNATDLPDFSEWRQEAFDIRLQLKNGRVEITARTNLYTNPGTGLELFKLPSATLAKSRIIEYDPAIKFP